MLSDDDLQALDDQAVRNCVNAGPGFDDNSIRREFARLIIEHAELELHRVKIGVACTKPEFLPSPEEAVNLCRDALLSLVPPNQENFDANNT